MNSAELDLCAQYPSYSIFSLTDGRTGNTFFDLMLSHREQGSR